jgi:hypothetical protein
MLGSVLEGHHFGCAWNVGRRAAGHPRLSGTPTCGCWANLLLLLRRDWEWSACAAYCGFGWIWRRSRIVLCYHIELRAVLGGAVRGGTPRNVWDL